MTKLSGLTIESEAIVCPVCQAFLVLILVMENVVLNTVVLLF